MTNSDTSLATAKPSSYLKVDNLETQEKVINLGKKLAASFQANSPDEITSWMINYLAEQIKLAESAHCEKAKLNCFNTILQLWENRAILPEGTRPFENLEPVFKALDSLSPENAYPRYFDYQTEDYTEEQLSNSATWLEAAKRLDVAARTIITFLFELAIADAITEDIKDWFTSMSDAVGASEFDLIGEFYEERAPDKTEQRIALLTNRIEQLETFEEISKSIRAGLNEELTALHSK
ncbi:hypothetical protein [Pseudoalteromonas ardens]|uniref:Uncharacterized protein n=1 Tax=Pseudoalteromonas rubra TaxID=43658 RepID=A0A0L0ENZ3_9GAMM|nr:hypothetical protein [Pseudoalteromonas sp. R96]KNC66116.1 hypothetical protein AC626_18980 [Pseudoalteromonas rubra]MDK1313648.1 hypothetical protein [Pseudoalteromonas sp. R96]